MVTPLTFARGDDELIDALRVQVTPGAAAVFYDRYAASVQRTLQSVLGRDAEIPDLLQDVFIRAIDRIGELEHLDQVRSWLTTIAVFAARAHIRRQTRRKWLFLFSPDQTKQRHLGAAVVGRAPRAARDLQDVGYVARERTHRVRAAVHRWFDVAGGGRRGRNFAGDAQAPVVARREAIPGTRTQAAAAGAVAAGRDEMDAREAELSRVGKKIRGALDAEAASSTRELRLTRRRFIDHVTTRDTGACDRPAMVLADARRSVRWARPAVVGAVVFGWTRLPISFQVISDAAPGAVAGTAGDVVEANAVVPTAVRFSEGSSIVLERGGRLRVLALESNGARVLVEKGAADVAIAHRRSPGKWRFEAGPVTVEVTGTRFRVDWNPEDRSFGIDLKEGSVIVGGDCLAGPRRVVRGDNLRLSCAPAVKMAKTESPSVQPVTPFRSSTEEGAPVRQHAVARRETREARSSEDGDWRALVAAGHYAEGVRAAERAGWTRVCRGANAVELLALADAARLSGETARAVEALMMLRQRFPGSTSAATGAFSLGRLAFERRGAYSEAARWFATYLDEQPHGPLMGDAVGRLMEARHRAGDQPAARRDAERYLQRFPEGPYAGTARVILAG